MVQAALHTDDGAAGPDARISGSGLVLAGDRSREFARARRHSVFIAILRVLFPLSATAISGLYIWTMLYTAGYGRPPTPPSISSTIEKEITMDNPTYEGFTKDGGKYTVTAKTAIPDLANPALVKLNDITGVEFDARKSRTDMKADHGLFDNKASRLDLSGNIEVVTQAGLHAKLTTATIMTKEGTIVSQQTETPVAIDMPTGQVTAYSMLLNQKTHDAAFSDRVKTHLLPQAKDGAPPAPQAPPLPSGPQAFGHSNAPVDVASDQLDIHDTSKIAIFTGNVHAVQSAATLETATLKVTYEGGPAGAAAAPAPVAPGQPAAPATKVKHIEAPGPVVLTQGTGEKITGNRADFEAADEIAVITGNVVMTALQDRHATADRVEFRQKSDWFLLTGNVVVVQARNELRGRRLVVDRKAGKTEMTSPAEGSLARSRIFAKLYQGDGKPGQPVKPAAAATAPEAPAGVMQFKTDPNAPVDIEADKLVSDDAKKTATFTGDVKAAQGDFTIRTSELIATHTGDGGLASMGSQGNPPAPGAPPKTPTQLSRIDARGKVVITSKVGQEVTGDAATFDMKANTGIVTGKEVIVDQDKHIVRCNKVKIDMNTGLSDCLWESGPDAGQTVSVPGVGTITTTAAPNGARPTRPSAVFYPDERPKSGQAAKALPQVTKPAASSWEASTAPSTN